MLQQKSGLKIVQVNSTARPTTTDKLKGKDFTPTPKTINANSNFRPNPVRTAPVNLQRLVCMLLI